MNDNEIKRWTLGKAESSCGLEKEVPIINLQKLVDDVRPPTRFVKSNKPKKTRRHVKRSTFFFNGLKSKIIADAVTIAEEDKDLENDPDFDLMKIKITNESDKYDLYLPGEKIDGNGHSSIFENISICDDHYISRFLQFTGEFWCAYCDRSFIELQFYVEHFDEFHTKCSGCGKEFDTYSLLDDHQRFCMKNRELKKQKRLRRDRIEDIFTNDEDDIKNEASTSKPVGKSENEKSQEKKTRRIQKKRKVTTKDEKIIIKRKKANDRKNLSRNNTSHLAWICKLCHPEHPKGLLFRCKETLGRHYTRKHKKKLIFDDMPSIPWVETEGLHYAYFKSFRVSKGVKPE